MVIKPEFKGNCFLYCKPVASGTIIFQDPLTKWAMVYAAPDQKVVRKAKLLAEEIVPMFCIPEALLQYVIIVPIYCQSNTTLVH